MVSRMTQKDVGAAEAKLIGPFTARQCIFLGIGGVIGFLIVTIVTATGADTFTGFLACAPFAGAVIALGFIHPYGMRPEDYLLQYYVYHILTPQVRLYSVKTAADAYFEELEKEQLETTGKKQAKKKKTTKARLPKPDPDYPMYL